MASADDGIPKLHLHGLDSGAAASRVITRERYRQLRGDESALHMVVDFTTAPASGQVCVSGRDSVAFVLAFKPALVGARLMRAPGEFVRVADLLPPEHAYNPKSIEQSVSRLRVALGAGRGQPNHGWFTRRRAADALDIRNAAHAFTPPAGLAWRIYFEARAERADAPAPSSLRLVELVRVEANPDRTYLEVIARVTNTSSDPLSVAAARLEVGATVYREVARYPLLGEIFIGEPPELQWRALRLPAYGACDVRSLWQRVSGPAPSPSATAARLVVEPTHGAGLDQLIPLPSPRDAS